MDNDQYYDGSEGHERQIDKDWWNQVFDHESEVQQKMKLDYSSLQLASQAGDCQQDWKGSQSAEEQNETQEIQTSGFGSIKSGIGDPGHIKTGDENSGGHLDTENRQSEGNSDEESKMMDLESADGRTSKNVKKDDHKKINSKIKKRKNKKICKKLKKCQKPQKNQPIYKNCLQFFSGVFVNYIKANVQVEQDETVTDCLNKLQKQPNLQNLDLFFKLQGIVRLRMAQLFYEKELWQKVLSSKIRTSKSKIQYGEVINVLKQGFISQKITRLSI